MGSQGSVRHENLRARRFRCAEFESDVRSARKKIEKNRKAGKPTTTTTTTTKTAASSSCCHQKQKRREEN